MRLLTFGVYDFQQGFAHSRSKSHKQLTPVGNIVKGETAVRAQKDKLLFPVFPHKGHWSFFIIPIVSIVVPFFGEPVLWLGSYNRDFG